MFGYVKTDNPNMYVKDTVLYRAMYCGLCKSIGSTCGQRGRLVLNYDLTFLSLFCHNICDVDVKIEKQKCVAHQLRKRPIAFPDELSNRIGSLNVILAYYKLNDDVIDENKGKVRRAFFNKAYKKAKRLEPKLDAIVKRRYDELVNYEKSSGKSIDISADPFGNMMQEIVTELCGENSTEDVKTLAYNLGKWVYLIDALDDFDKDKKKKSFNVFVNSYPEIKTKKELIEKYSKDITLVFATVLSEMCENGKKIDYKFNHDLIDNILFCGLKKQTKTVMEKEKCKKYSKS